MAKILITGGSGLVGKAVSELLIKKGHEPRWLSREEGMENGIQKFKWDVGKQYINEKAFEGVEVIVHLAGAGIGSRRWTKKYKQEIIDSRVKSSELLFQYISKNKYPVKTLAGASAVGYYGARQSEDVFSEEDAPGSDFLAQCCVQWENSYRPFAASGIRVCILRSALALSTKGGTYALLAKPFKWGFGAAMGSGRQYLSWIHINDLAAMYVKAVTDASISGVYNAVAPELVTNQQFSEQLAQSLHKPLFLPNIPKAVLQLAIGESAIALCEGLKISSQKIKDAGFMFEFDHLLPALNCLADS